MKWPPQTRKEMLAIQKAYGSDYNISRAVNRTRFTVNEIRSKFNIPPYHAPKKKPYRMAPGKTLTEREISTLYAGRTYQ